MANKEQDYVPQAKPADEATKPCQEFIRLYPTRLTLTDKAFEKIRTEGTTPVMPKGIPTAGDDYELRRLRTGYVYILAAKAECKNFEITWEAENGNAWYIYTCYNNDKGTDLSQWSRFEIEDIIEAEKPQNDISTTQETANTKKEENKPEQYADVDTVSAKPGLNTEYIELNLAI